MVKEQICQPINEAAGYSFTTMNGGLVAFNNSTVMLISVKGTSQIEKAKEGITNLLKQTADNSIAKSGAFQKMEKQKSDTISSLPWQLFLHLIKSKSVWDFPLK